MKKTFKHNGKTCEIEVQEGKNEVVITGLISGKEVGRTIVQKTDPDMEHYLDIMENDLKGQSDKKPKLASVKKILLKKGFN